MYGGRGDGACNLFVYTTYGGPNTSTGSRGERIGTMYGYGVTSFFGEMGHVTCLYIPLMGVPTHPQEVGGTELGPCMVMGLQHVWGLGHVTCLYIPLMGVPTHPQEVGGKELGPCLVTRLQHVRAT